MKYIVQFTTSEQYTPNPEDWKPITPTLTVTEHTTIREIREWMSKRGESRINEFKVITPDILDK